MKQGKEQLDFLIIGAQKSGTTSLFKLLCEHPDIHMPAEKEAPYFNLDDRYEKGWQWFLEEFFEQAPENKLWGKASPQYMADPRVAERIFNTTPKTKLIAIVRHPVERAYSHYKMSVRRTIEERSFEDSVKLQLRPEALVESRQLPAHPSSENQSYLVWGEYGRILDNYLNYFPREQLLVVFTETLENKPQQILAKVLEFLELPSYTPSSLGKRFHQGGSKQRLPWVKRLVNETPLSVLWQALPAKRRRTFAYWFKQHNTLPDKTVNTPIDLQLRQLLIDYFQDDVSLLEQVIGEQVPWSEFAS